VEKKLFKKISVMWVLEAVGLKVIRNLPNFSKKKKN